ncbi:type IV leader peptidase family protein [archaeon BMS3Abin17]|nr:type IV leader peptidase family protein [archaeon BMS3Abin17]HDZ60443.1 hypothetical protein [Candidatus Pacearchaeota archaeon]
MNEVIFLLAIGLIWIIFASIQDLRSREVANWLSFSLIIFALGFRFFYSLFSGGDFNFFYQGLIGLGIFFVLGNLLYYGRMFAGGDAKLMIALGAILPLSNSLFGNFRIFFVFFLIFLFAGMFYSLTWSLVLALRNARAFRKEFFKIFVKNKKILYPVMIFGLIIMLFGFANTLLFYFGTLFFLFPYLYIYAKAVDEACMVKKIKVSELTEGDWLYKDVKVGRKLIKASWNGLSKEDIKRIKKKHRSIVIRQGVPFVPVFLISFLILIGYYFRISLNL